MCIQQRQSVLHSHTRQSSTSLLGPSSRLNKVMECDFVLLLQIVSIWIDFSGSQAQKEPGICRKTRIKLNRCKTYKDVLTYFGEHIHTVLILDLLTIR